MTSCGVGGAGDITSTFPAALYGVTEEDYLFIPLATRGGASAVPRFIKVAHPARFELTTFAFGGQDSQS